MIGKVWHWRCPVKDCMDKGNGKRSSGSRIPQNMTKTRAHARQHMLNVHPDIDPDTVIFFKAETGTQDGIQDENHS